MVSLTPLERARESIREPINVIYDYIHMECERGEFDRQVEGYLAVQQQVQMLDHQHFGI